MPRSMVLTNILWLLLAAPALADTMVGVNSLFFYGHDYPGQPHHLTLILKSDQFATSVEATLPTFGEYRPVSTFILPVGNKLEFTVQENKAALKTLALHKQGNKVDVETDCQKQEDMHSVFPYFPFSSYIPPNTITFMCDTKAGALEVRFICHDESDCW